MLHELQDIITIMNIEIYINTESFEYASGWIKGADDNVV